MLSPLGGLGFRDVPNDLLSVLQNADGRLRSGKLVNLYANRAKYK